MKKILIIEPTHGSNVHLPFNAGLLKTVAIAYESAKVAFVGDAVQIEKIMETLPDNLRNRCEFIEWEVYDDRDTSPINVLTRMIRLLKAVGSKIFSADLVILSSTTGTALAALGLLMRPKKQILQIFLHGNLNNLYGWRSRNPFKRLYDLHSRLKCAAASHAQFLVLEEHILEKSIAEFPWMKKNIRYFPHPQIDEESIKHEKKLQYPIKIGLAGISSPDKGFAEFCKLAHLLKERFPQKFEFHVIGKKHKSNHQADFRILDQAPSEMQLERKEYLGKIDAMNFLFFWPVGDYYKYASSGVFYDGLNRKIPFLTNCSVNSFRTGIAEMGIVSETVDELASRLLEVDSFGYANYITQLTIYRDCLSIDSLVPKYRRLIDEFKDSFSANSAKDVNASTEMVISADKS
jgi:hypothetical protein